MNILKSRLIFCLFFLSFNSYPYGKTGHRIVGELAQRHLSFKSKRLIKEILGEEKLSHAALWADEIKSDRNYDYAKVYHRINFPKDVDFNKIQIGKDNIIWALVHFEDVLRSSTSKMDDKKFALRFILHLLGDLHQPLHTGYAEDAGGNKINVFWFKKEVNLHQVWDEDLILFEELSFSEYSDKLDLSDKKKIAEIQRGNYLDWTIESNSFLPLVYEFPTPNLGYDYHYKVKEVLYSLLQKAGFRLAHTLNRIFENKPLTPSEISLRKKIAL